MKTKSFGWKALALALLTLLACVEAAASAEIKVMSSAGFATAYKELAAEFERTTENKIVNAWGPSMGSTPQAVPNRIARGEPVDVVIIVGEALDGLIRQGKVVADSRVVLARAAITMAVRQGAPKPDIGTVEAFKKTLLAAKYIAYSDSASGVYLETVLFPRLGIADAHMRKSRMITADPVDAVVAKAEAEIGFRQTSEEVPLNSYQVMAPIPDEIQK